MSFRLRHFLIRFLLPITWKKSSAQKVRVLQEFAQTELDSAWQSIYAIERVENSGLRSLLFQHAMEELFHSDLFRRLASHKSSELPSAPLTRREPLLFLEKGAEKSAVEFFAYLAIGENEIKSDFDAYEHAIPDEDVRQLFQAIRGDEEHHARDSSKALMDLTRKNGVSLRWIQVRHLSMLFWRRYLSLMNKVGTLPMNILLSSAYFLFGGFFFLQARERIRGNRDFQLNVLKKQKIYLDKSLERHK